MRVLVVYCHPVPESFCAAVRDATVAALGEQGSQVRLVDLYGERFDPVMPADERRTRQAAQPSIERARRGALDAHRITVTEVAEDA